MEEKRRQFIKYAVTGIGAGVTIPLVEKMKIQGVKSSPAQFLGGFDIVVYGSPSTGYTAVTSSGTIIFQGNCSQGSGTCGIYEAIDYAVNHGYGRVALLGQFYPTSSPSQFPNYEATVDGNAVVYASGSSLLMCMWLYNYTSNSIRIQWYEKAGVLNSILLRRPSFSQNPYVIFDTPAESLFFSNGQQALGTPSSFSISAWVYGQGNNNGGYILTYGSLEKGKIWSLYMGWGNVYFSGISSSIPSVPFHVAVTCSNGICDLYVNGGLASSGTVSMDYSISPAYLWIGNFPIQNQQSGILPINGRAVIENVQIYSEALSSSQIGTLASTPMQDPIDYGSLIFWALYRGIFYVGDLVTGKGFQRMGALLKSGVF
ncbi:hypothetical protein HS7_15340 [Sulfolobales archaeon HS-7]|nr:hypothetical protein HS7_15340 [Sulfolobales archaeon HS-7]